MLFVAIHSHPASSCPRETTSGRKMIKRVFSNESIRKAGVRIVGSYLSCPKATGEDHKGFFIVEADTAAAVIKFFGPLTVDVRQVVPFSEVLSKL